ncbi:hypothetical protein GGX14DRAFT_700930 [Mycena pura]|uniref:Uncharacterized protein n=1 Tax=Mycena pura TaxID=153505 RepID=A0AAD6UX75_9AGAR|nr:hypothetical protein GGX14DRAFT_700930 [Mycena pura]
MKSREVEGAEEDLCTRTTLTPRPSASPSVAAAGRPRRARARRASPPYPSIRTPPTSDFAARRLKSATRRTHYVEQHRRPPRYRSPPAARRYPPLAAARPLVIVVSTRPPAFCAKSARHPPIRRTQPAGYLPLHAPHATRPVRPYRSLLSRRRQGIREYAAGLTFSSTPLRHATSQLPPAIPMPPSATILALASGKPGVRGWRQRVRVRLVVSVQLFLVSFFLPSHFPSIGHWHLFTACTIADVAVHDEPSVRRNWYVPVTYRFPVRCF